MRKSIIKVFAMLLVAGVAFVSCSKESSEIESSSKGYKVRIPANKISSKAVAEGGVATFKTIENVYVCNTSKSNAIDGTVLHPIADAPSTSFDGILTGSYSEGDNLKILYNTNASGVADYSSQNGTIEGVVDAGLASNVHVTSIVGSTITTEVASIDNLQSIFKFNFKIAGTDYYLGKSVRFVRIISSQNQLVSQHNSVTGVSTKGPVTISRDEDLPEEHPCVYAALRFNSNPGDEIVFQVVTKDGKVYSGSKTAPSGGFSNGKFYTSTVTVNLYTFTVSSGGQKVCFSPGDLGVDNGVYSFTEPFTAWNQDKTSMTEKTNSPSTSKRTWFIRSEVQDGQTVYGFDWRIQSLAEWKYLVGLNEGRTIDAGNVSLYYKVHINTTALGDRYWCYLLPPDETKASDIGEDLTSGIVTDYLKYIAKGFVLLMDTEHSYRLSSSATASWTYKSRADKHSGYYQVGYTSGSKTYISFGSDGPVQNSGNNGYEYRIHTRYIHDVTVSTP